jgi:hypothetical protein
LLGTVEALLEGNGRKLWPEERLVYEQGVSFVRAWLSEEEFEKAWKEGRAMSLEQAIQYARLGGELIKGYIHAQYCSCELHGCPCRYMLHSGMRRAIAA